MEKINVLHVIQSFGSGGTEKLLDDMLPLIAKENGIDVFLLILENKEEKNVFLNKIKKSKVKIIYGNGYSSRSIDNLYHISKIITKYSIDIVHVHLFPEIYYVSLISKMPRFKKNVKFVLTEHSTFNGRRNFNFLKSIERIIYKGFDKIISISQGVKDSLCNWLGEDYFYFKQHQIISNGIDISDYTNAKPYRKSDFFSEIQQNDNLFCMVGRFVEEKDQETIIKAMKYLPENTYLLLVGDGPLKEFLQQKVEDLSLNHRVLFTGVRKDVPRILKTVDAVIVSSHIEGFGLVAVEGMSAGKPVIASNVEGLSEVVKDYGLLFKQTDYKELAAIMQKIILKDHYKNEVAEKCLYRAQDFSIEKTAEDHIILYKKLRGG